MRSWILIALLVSVDIGSFVLGIEEPMFSSFAIIDFWVYNLFSIVIFLKIKNSRHLELLTVINISLSSIFFLFGTCYFGFLNELNVLLLIVLFLFKSIAIEIALLFLLDRILQINKEIKELQRQQIQNN